MSSSHDASSGRAQFLTTRWSLVASLTQPDPPRARAALTELCELYWTPLYAFLRRRGLDSHAAADTVQGFFAELVEKRNFGELSADRGRFRSFLLAALSHHLSHERARAGALKRGGGASIVSIDPVDADERLQVATTGELTPEHAFEREWALSLLARALASVRADLESDGKLELFTLLRPALQGAELSDVAGIAHKAGMTEGAVRVAATRLRKRYREALRSLIRDTVEHESDVDAEIADLFRALGGR
jgi:RNA polymerase sigma-70 factor (ECF subfamily)